MSEPSRTDFGSTIFAKRPGLAVERFAAPKTDGNALASEQALGISPLGTLVKAIAAGQPLDFEPGSSLLVQEGTALKVPNPVPQALAPNGTTGKRRRIQDYAVSTWQSYFVIGPLTQIVFLSADSSHHLRLINFLPASDGQSALLLFEPRGAEGQLVIFAPGGYVIA